MQTQPTTQQYRNPLKWGWYYVEEVSSNSGLMSKRAARKYLKSSRLHGHYGVRITIHTNAPQLKLVRRVSFPVRSLG